MGDFNWVSPQFLAFASPQSAITAPIPTTSPQYAELPTCIPEIVTANISNPFKNVLTHFVARNIGLVVRLNSPLYSPTYFTALGINHIDMIFDDGTCPPLPLVQKFIRLAHDMINRKKGIAVHCKAGLGRTGCLIGAYLIYRHGFTANEVISFMRFMRPGMVVGPQQHWLHLNQGQFREWYLEDQLKAKLEATTAMKPSTPRKGNVKTPARLVSNGQTATPPNGSQRQASRSALGEIDGNDCTSHTSTTAAAPSYEDENLPAPTPGQPRKYARMDARHHPYARSASGTAAAAAFSLAEDPQECVKPETEIVSLQTHRTSCGGGGECESEEEYTLRMLAHRRSVSRSPGTKSSGKKGVTGGGRSVSYTTTTTTMTKFVDEDVGIFDEENQDENAKRAENGIWDEAITGMGHSNASGAAGGASATTRSKTPKSASACGSGAAGIGVQKTRPQAAQASPTRRSGGEEKARVRKVSVSANATGGRRVGSGSGSLR